MRISFAGDPLTPCTTLRPANVRKAAALKHAPEATDLTDVKMDYRQRGICGINTVVVTMTATAIKYNK